MIKLLHFADTHIDMAGHSGRRDPETGLPLRVQDFLAALDTIIDTAIAEKVDVVLFAGDAYRDRTPAPTYQREWERRIVRLSQAGIPTVLLLGNHDISPAVGRAHTLQEFDTLNVANVHVIAKPRLLKPDNLNGVRLQVAAIPWVYRSGLVAREGIESTEANETIENRIGEIADEMIEQSDPDIPLVLLAHGSVAGASLGYERTIMLGADFILPGRIVRNPRFAYVALGHIHKAQDLNEGQHPPVVYSGSIERVDFGEAQDEKSFVIATIDDDNKATYERRPLNGRGFIDRHVKITSEEHFMEQALAALPSPKKVAGAMLRLTIEYPREWEAALDEATLRQHCQEAFEFHLVRRVLERTRGRLMEGATSASMDPLELLQTYWDSIQTPLEESQTLKSLAKEVIDSTMMDSEGSEGMA